MPNTFGSAGNPTSSTQVLQEFFVAVARKLTPPLSSKTAYEFSGEFYLLSVGSNRTGP